MNRLALRIAILLAITGTYGWCAQPTIKAVRIEVPPGVDGDLSDACWQQATATTEFYYATDDTKAAEPTTAYICYDSKNMYVAFYCKDSQPDKVSVQQTKRGGDIATDDWVGFQFDGSASYYNDQMNWFKVTAGGVQLERVAAGDATKIEWRGDWKASARRVPDGYVVEMAVPFSILKYNATRTSIPIAFGRGHARMNQQWWAPNLGSNYDMRRSYLWDEVKLPWTKPQPVILGYSLVGTGDGGSSLRSGLDYRQALSPSMNALATISPDFSSVEQDVDRIDFSYNQRPLSDSRPFFQEGAGFFPGSRVFYTRRIPDIDAGIKLSGKTGLYDLAAVHVEEFGGQDHSVVQFGRHWNDGGTRLWLGSMHSTLPGADNTVNLMSWRHRAYERNERQIIFSGSYVTSDSEQGLGKWYGMKLYNIAKPRELNWTLYREVVQPEFNPYLGITPDPDRRSWTGDLNWWDEPSKGKVSAWYAGLEMTDASHTNGSKFYDNVTAYCDLYFRDGRGAYLAVSQSHRPPNDDRLIETSYSWGGRDLYRKGSASLSFGEQGGGDYLFWQLAQGLKVNDKLSFRGQYGYASVEPPSLYAYTTRQLVASMVYDLSQERTAGGRLVHSNGDSNLYLWFRQRVRTGMDAYLIVGDPNAKSTSGSITLKLIRTM